MFLKFDNQALLSGALGSLLGALVGGAVFYGLWEFGLYVPVLVFAGAGLGSGSFLQRRYWLSGVVAVIVGITGNAYVEWSCRPFSVDQTFSYYLGHLPDLAPLPFFGIAIPWYMVWGVGVGVAVWFGKGHYREPLDPPAPHLE